jgi:cytochrome P450 family 4
MRYYRNMKIWVSMKKNRSLKLFQESKLIRYKWEPHRCVYIYIYIYMYIYRCVYMFIYLFEYIHLSIYIYVFTVSEGRGVMEGCLHLYAQMSMSICFLYLFMYIYIHIYVYMYVYRCAYTHIYIHIYSLKGMRSYGRLPLRVDVYV